MEFEIQSMSLGMLGTNCYLGIRKDTLDTLIFDPGAEGDRLIRYIEREGLHPAAILLTHGHYDHIMAVRDLKEKYNLPVYAHEAEQEVLENPAFNLSTMFGSPVHMKADHPVTDGQMLEIAGVKIQVLHTPGHTPGGVSYYIDEATILISGDTLFADSVGRTDFPMGSMHTLVRSVREKLFVLEDDVSVLPGHGPETTIGWEKKNNPFVQ